MKLHRNCSKLITIYVHNCTTIRRCTVKYVQLYRSMKLQRAPAFEQQTPRADLLPRCVLSAMEVLCLVLFQATMAFPGGCDG